MSLVTTVSSSLGNFKYMYRKFTGSPINHSKEGKVESPTGQELGPEYCFSFLYEILVPRG